LHELKIMCFADRPDFATIRRHPKNNCSSRLEKIQPYTYTTLSNLQNLQIFSNCKTYHLPQKFKIRYLYALYIHCPYSFVVLSPYIDADESETRNGSQNIVKNGGHPL